MTNAATIAGVRRNEAARASAAVMSPPPYQADTSRPIAPPRKNSDSAASAAAP